MLADDPERLHAIARRVAGTCGVRRWALVSAQRLRADRRRSRLLQPLMLLALAVVAGAAIVAAMLFVDAAAIGWQRAPAA